MIGRMFKELMKAVNEIKYELKTIRKIIQGWDKDE